MAQRRRLLLSIDNEREGLGLGSHFIKAAAFQDGFAL